MLLFRSLEQESRTLWTDCSWILRNRYNPANSEARLGCCQLLLTHIKLIQWFQSTSWEKMQKGQILPPTSISLPLINFPRDSLACCRVHSQQSHLRASARRQNKTSLKKRFLYISVLSKTVPYIETEDFPSRQGFLWCFPKGLHFNEEPVHTYKFMQSVYP